jgi:transcriptional regulator with XRE-family HTH domain
MAAEPSRTLRRKQLGAAIKNLRESAEITREAAAERLHCSVSKIGRMETGDVGARLIDLEALLDLYGTTDAAEREELVALAKDGKKRGGWWLKYSDLPRKYLRLIELESVATAIRWYEGQVMPGLLQTEAYARAIIRATCPDETPQEIEDKVKVRLKSQEFLTGGRETVPDTVFVLDEAALHRKIGGPDVLREQLLHLVELSERPRLTLQVLPFDHGGHEATTGPFIVLRFPHPDPDIVYAETFIGSAFLEEPPDVERCARIFERLTEAALSQPKSVDFIREIARE